MNPTSTKIANTHRVEMKQLHHVYDICGVCELILAMKLVKNRGGGMINTPKNEAAIPHTQLRSFPSQTEQKSAKVHKMRTALISDTVTYSLQHQSCVIPSRLKARPTV